MTEKNKLTMQRFTEFLNTASEQLAADPPTGKKIEVQAMNFYRFADGQIVEEHGQPDLLGLLQQIRAVPA